MNVTYFSNQENMSFRNQVLHGVIIYSELSDIVNIQPITTFAKISFQRRKINYRE